MDYPPDWLDCWVALLMSPSERPTEHQKMVRKSVTYLASTKDIEKTVFNAGKYFKSRQQLFSAMHAYVNIATQKINGDILLEARSRLQDIET